jgi:uncharacterized UPF0160 family protein
MITIGTHSGPFHADDVLAVAIITLAKYSEGTPQIVRSRDPKVLAECQVLVDVGGVYDFSQSKFDHHQKGGAGVRENGIPYSSAGLVWAHFGTFAVERALPKYDNWSRPWEKGLKIEINEIVDLVDQELIQQVDSLDCGVGSRILKDDLEHVTFSDVISQFNPNWYEGVDSAAMPLFDNRFKEAVSFAVEHLTRVIRSVYGKILARSTAETAIEQALDQGKIVTLDQFAPVMEHVCNNSQVALYLVFPQGEDWLVQCVPPKMGSFAQRQPLPESWAGLRGAELAAVCGVSDAVFTHNGRFIGGARSKEGAIEMARKAVR